ncbi:MAG: restriction endonuclease [Candidatus Woesearchaeota archaeon]
MNAIVYITKSNGEQAQFDKNKLLTSLSNAGASRDVAERVLQRVLKQLYDGIKTKKIYSIAFRELRRIDNPVASRYEIKWAIMRLGKMQGFSFEQYMGKLFRKMGYKVKVGQVVRGRNITHEIDLILEKDKERILVECKHHSTPGIWVHIHTPLYVYARLLDVKDKFTGAMVATNTRFSDQSIQYAKGVGLKLLSWNYPDTNNLRNMINSSNLFPVTVLKSVDDVTLDRLLKNELVTLPDLEETPIGYLSKIIGSRKAAEVMKEVKEIVKI